MLRPALTPRSRTRLVGWLLLCLLAGRALLLHHAALHPGHAGESAHHEALWWDGHEEGDAHCLALLDLADGAATAPDVALPPLAELLQAQAQAQEPHSACRALPQPRARGPPRASAFA